MTLRSCPICNTDQASARVFMEENLEAGRLTSFSFASRKIPEFMCHRLVLCPTCDLVYASDPPNQLVLQQAYHAAEFDSDQEAADAAAVYDRAVGPIVSGLEARSAALEIGTGTGVFLDALRDRGFEVVAGIEPSAAAIAAAPAYRRLWIREAIFDEADYAPESFDFICCFMTLEHVSDPRALVRGVLSLLKPGGAIALVTHDYRSWINRMLGRRSPIIDVEHMQLFSPKSIRTILETNGFENIVVSDFSNRYALNYWMRLLPLSVPLKKVAIKTVTYLGAADLKLSFNVGNMFTYGYRPKR